MLLQQLVNGLTLGAVYTLLALSYGLVMGILGILNLAIAELFMIGGYAGFAALVAGLPLPVAVAAGMVVAAALAAVIDKVGYEPLRGGPALTPMLSTLGFSIVIQNLATNVWGSDPLQMPDRYLGGQVDLGPIRIGTIQLVILGATVLLVAAVATLVQKTALGRALRAVAENREVARLLGVSAKRLVLFAFVLSGGLAGAAGVLIALHYGTITPYIGVEIGLKAIAVMVVGGTTRIWGSLLAGPVVGIAEVLTVAYGGSQVRDFVVYGLMILILLLRPQGLLGGPLRDQGERV